MNDKLMKDHNQKYQIGNPQESIYKLVHLKYPDALAKTVEELRKDEPKCVALLRNLDIPANSMHSIINTAMHLLNQQNIKK